MSLKYSTIGIDGKTYTINQFSAPKSLKLMIRLGKILGAPISEIAMGDGLKGDKVEGAIGKSIGMLFERMDEDMVIETIHMILENTLDGSMSVNSDFDTRFQGDQLPVLFKLIAATLKVQYGSFGNVLALLTQRAQMAGTSFSVLSTSSGPSGG